jgi:hypothetical protein
MRPTGGRGAAKRRRQKAVAAAAAQKWRCAAALKANRLGLRRGAAGVEAMQVHNNGQHPMLQNSRRE